MSTRVQKGGTVFRPVARNKARDSSRQPSTAPESRNSAAPFEPEHSSSDVPSNTPSISLQSTNKVPGSTAVSHGPADASNHIELSQSVSAPLPVGQRIVIGSSRFAVPDTNAHTFKPSPSSDVSQQIPAGNPISTPARRTPAPPSIGQSGSTPLTTPNASQRPPVVPTSGPSQVPIPALPAANTQTAQVQLDNGPVAPHVERTTFPPTATTEQSLTKHLTAPTEAQRALNDQADPKARAKRPKPSRKGKEKATDITQRAAPNDITNESSEAASSQGRSRRRRTPKSSAVVDEDTSELESTGVSERKKARRKSTVESDSDPDTGSSPPRTRRRSTTSGSSRRGRSRAPTLPPFDPDAEPGEELDPTATSMSMLCEDTGRGRVSSKAAQVQSNYAAWKTSNKQKRERMRAIQEAKKYGRHDDEDGRLRHETPAPLPGASQDLATPTAGSSQDMSSADPASGQETGEAATGSTAHGDAFDYSQVLNTSRYNVQVRVGPNGETIVDEESLFVDRNEEKQTEEYTHVEESDLTKFVNSNTYGKKATVSRWDAHETELFYNALQQFGEDYEMISIIIPGRDRKACKNKFKAEDKKNSAQIDYCLKNRIEVDWATLSRLTGKDFTGPTPEIRIPENTGQTMKESASATSEKGSHKPPTPKKVRKKSRTPGGVTSGDEEVLGNVEDFNVDDETLFGKDDKDD